MLLLAKGHYQATLGWIMGPLLRLWQWFIAFSSKPPSTADQIDGKVIPMAQPSASTSSETAPPMMVEPNPTIHEDVQQPAMYIYNLSRSQWANRLNLEWIYLDVMERDEESFQLLVNTVPEEPTRGYSEEMDGAFEALSHWITHRNEHPLHSIESMSGPKGELRPLDNTSSLNEIITSHNGSKRLLFAGGNKIFYRQLAEIGVSHFQVCEEESIRLKTVSDALQDQHDTYIQDFFGQDTLHLMAELNINIPPVTELERKIPARLGIDFKLTRLHRSGREMEDNKAMRLISAQINKVLNQLEHHSNDIRSNVSFSFNWEGEELRLKPSKLLQVVGEDRNELRATTKALGKITIFVQGEEEGVELPYSSQKNNSETLVLSQNSGNQMYSFSFDARNIQRSIAKILSLLESGPVLVSHPETFTNRFQTWFKQESSSTSANEIVQILDNLNGRQIRELFVNDGLKDARLVSEIEVSMTLQRMHWCRTVAFMFREAVRNRKGAPLPETPLQEWPSFDTPETLQEMLISKDSDSKINPISYAPPWERLLNDALQISTAKPPFSISEGSVLYPEEHGMTEKRNGEWAKKNGALTSDATMFLKYDTKESRFIVFDATVSQGWERGHERKSELKFEKYYPVDFGKSNITNSIIVMLATSTPNSEQIPQKLGLDRRQFEKVLVVNLSKLEADGQCNITSNQLSEWVSDLISNIDEVVGLEFSYNPEEKDWIRRALG